MNVLFLFVKVVLIFWK